MKKHFNQQPSGEHKVKRGIFDPSITLHRERVHAAKPAFDPVKTYYMDALVPIGENTRIPVRIYAPDLPNKDKRPLPTLFYIPGTAFIAQETQFTHGVCSRTSAIAKCCVVVINHRLAPENQFPAGLQDCYGIIKSFLKKMPIHVLVDSSNIAIAGYSSGGSIALSIAIQAKEEGIHFNKLILMSPIVDLTRSVSKGFEEFQNADTDISEKFVDWFLDLYVPENQDLKSPEISPFFYPIEKIQGIAPVTIFVGEFDRFRGDSEHLYVKLQEAKVRVEKKMLPGAKHSYFWHSLAVIEDFASTVRRAFDCSSFIELNNVAFFRVPSLQRNELPEESIKHEGSIKNFNLMPKL
jgi:acetyl esterase